MNNKRGFTLVELLAVIVILAVILVIAIPNVIKVIDKAKLDTYKRNEDMLVSATQKYMAANGISLNVGETRTITYSDLTSDKFVDRIIDQTSRSECISSKVIITKTTTSYTYKPLLICDNYIKQDTLDTYSLIVNGDFSNGSSGWSSSYGTINVSNNVATVTNTSSTYSNFVRGTASILSDQLQNHIIFLKATMRIKGSSSNHIYIGSSNGLGNLSPAESSRIVATPEADKWYDVYGTINYGIGTNTSQIVKIYMTYGDSTLAFNKQMEVKDVIVLDLTSMYGSSIPSADNIYNNIIKSRY
jgi:type IV pilus assembly protein PilA